MTDDSRLDIESLPDLEQRQDALNDQMVDLYRAAVRLGLYDAADHIQGAGGMNIRYGCHFESDAENIIDGCVFHGGNTDHCIYARSGSVSCAEDCSYWQPIKMVDEWKAQGV